MVVVGCCWLLLLVVGGGGWWWRLVVMIGGDDDGDDDDSYLIFPGEAERVMVLIAQDGVQRPPIRFPTTGSLMRFLECLESGLVPYGRLDPPLANESDGRSLVW